MQNLETNNENTNPDNFHNSNSATTNLYANETSNANSLDLAERSTELNSAVDTTSRTTTGATRPKFSFAANYTPSRHFSGLLATHSYNTNPPIASAPAFAVLNNDFTNFPSNPNKPNAIVHPTRRTEQAALPKSYNDLNGELRITGYNPSLAITQPPLGACHAHHFAEELNRKLNHLNSIQENRNFKNPSNHICNQDAFNQRPLFITTVPRGIFLPPPKDIILLSPTRKRQLYAYSSHPVVYNTTSSALSPSYCNNMHYDHKVKGNIGKQTNANKNCYAMINDKYCNGNNSGSAGDGGGGDGGGGAAVVDATDSENNAADDEGTIEVVVNDKNLITAAATVRKASSLLSGVSKNFNSSTMPMLSGLLITKQQFHQQLKQARSKRETPTPEPYRNVMHEKRIVRGSNFAGNQFLGEYDPFDKAAEYRRRQVLRKKNVTYKNQRNVLGTPPPVKGRRHENVQTDKYLEELVARPTEASIQTQTDLFLEKPPTPPYIPAKIGIDVATEIDDNELFQFESEAQPIIDVMVDSIIELSILQVAHEQEISAIRTKQQELLAEREKEMAELRRLEEEEARLRAEKERRLRQDDIAKMLDDEMQKNVTAAKLLQGHIASILPEILDSLEPATDDAKKDKLKTTIYPWLSAQVAEEVGQIVDSREILTVIIQEIIKQRAEIYASYKEELATEQEQTVAEEEEEETLAEEHDLTETCETEEEPIQSTGPPNET